MDISFTVAFTPSKWANWTTASELSTIDSDEMAAEIEVFTEIAAQNSVMSEASEDAVGFVVSPALLGNINGTDLLDYHISLMDHVQRIFCTVHAIFLYVYVEIRVSPQWADAIIRGLNDCSSGGVIVVRFDQICPLIKLRIIFR